MSTQITAVYDKWHTIISANLSDYKRLPNAYQDDLNSDLLLRSGYSVGIGSANNSNRLINCKASIDREFTIKLIQEKISTDHDTTKGSNIEKDLFEDAIKLIKIVEKDPTLAGTATNARWLSDGGIEIVETENSRFFRLSLVFGVEYLESL